MGEILSLVGLGLGLLLILSYLRALHQKLGRLLNFLDGAHVERRKERHNDRGAAGVFRQTLLEELRGCRGAAEASIPGPRAQVPPAKPAREEEAFGERDSGDLQTKLFWAPVVAEIAGEGPVRSAIERVGASAGGVGT